MPKFLTREEIYSLIQRELPENAYPHGPPDRYYSTADSDATAKVLADGYDNLEKIYDNYFPQTAVESLDEWLFKTYERPNLNGTVEEKRQLILNKLRKQPTITNWEVLQTVLGFVPDNVFVQVFFQCFNADFGWVLGNSALGTFTGLNPISQGLNIPGDELCDYFKNLHWRIGSDRLGVNTTLGNVNYTMLALAQRRAFLYEIRIFDYEVTGQQYNDMIEAIKAAEPARSTHIIQQNQNLADYGLINDFLNVTQFSGVNCVAKDPAQQTGFIGKVM